MNTLKITPGFKKMHKGSVKANLLALPKTGEDKPARSVSAVAYELRDPLTSINLSIDLLQSEIKDNCLQIYLDIITRSSQRMSDMINDMLKLREGEEIHTRKHSIYQLLDEIIEMARGQMIPENIRIRKDNEAKGCTIEIMLDKTVH